MTPQYLTPLNQQHHLRRSDIANMQPMAASVPGANVKPARKISSFRPFTIRKWRHADRSGIFRCWRNCERSLHGRGLKKIRLDRPLGFTRQDVVTARLRRAIRGFATCHRQPTGCRRPTSTTTTNGRKGPPHRGPIEKFRNVSLCEFIFAADATVCIFRPCFPETWYELISNHTDRPNHGRCDACLPHGLTTRPSDAEKCFGRENALQSTDC
jgi:hypothetical protein